MISLHDYLMEIRHALACFTGVQIEQYRQKLLTDTRANLRIRLH